MKMSTKIAPQGSALKLPTEPSTPETDLGMYSILLYGEPKVGKTSLAAQFPDVFGLMFEPGARALKMYQQEVHSWVDFKSYLDLLEKSPSRFKTLLVDTVDVAYQNCLAYVCKQEGFDHPADEGYGKGWNKVNTEFNSQVRRILKMGRGVIFTSHAAEKDIKTRLGEEYTKIVPTMTGGARATCETLVDIWVYMAHDKVGRTLRLRGNDHIACGHRLQENFVGLETIPAGKDARTAYENLVAAFNNKLKLEPAPRVKLQLGKH